MTEAPNTHTETNRATIRDVFDAWMQGTGAISEVFVLTPFGARFRSADPFRPTVIREVFADGDTVIVLWDGRGITHDGQPY